MVTSASCRVSRTHSHANVGLEPGRPAARALAAIAAIALLGLSGIGIGALGANTYRRGPGTRPQEIVPRAALGQPPFSSVLRLSGRRRDGAGFYCNASLVENPHIAVTNAHCVAEGGRVYPFLAVQPAGTLDIWNGRYDVRVFALGNGEAARQNDQLESLHPEDDYAVLYLPQQLPGRVVPFRLDASPLSAATAIEAIGFSWDAGREQTLLHIWCRNMRQDDGACRGHDVIFHDCDSAEGSSGMPLVYRGAGGAYTLLGIHQGQHSGRGGAVQRGVAWGLGTTNFGVKARRFSAAVRRLRQLIAQHRPIPSYM